MKYLFLTLSLSLFSVAASAAWTQVQPGNNVAITTRSQARTALSAAKTSSSITTTNTQAYTDCGGCPIPNDTGMACMACVPMGGL